MNAYLPSQAELEGAVRLSLPRPVPEELRVDTSLLTAHLDAVHVVEVIGSGALGDRSVHTSLRDAEVAAAALRAGRECAGVTIRQVLINPQWPEAASDDRIATDIDLAEFDEIVVVSEVEATDHCHLGLIHDPAHVAQVTQSLGALAATASEPPGRRDCCTDR